MLSKSAFASGWDSDDAAAVAASDAVGLLSLQKTAAPVSEAASLSTLGVSTQASPTPSAGEAGSTAPDMDVAAPFQHQLIGETPRNAGTNNIDHGTNTGVGRTVRTGIATTTVAATPFFNNQDINGILAGSAWGSAPGAQTLTFSFPTASSQYGTSFGTGAGQYNDQAPFNGFQVLTDAQKAVVRYALGLVSQYTQLSFSEITETSTTHATLRYAGSAQPATSYAYYPATSGVAGDAFYGNVRNSPPTKAGYAFDTIMHEIGHNLGLKHGQEANTTYGTVSAEHLSTEWSIMTYQAYVGTPNNYYSNAEGSGNQTYMIDDIAALQYLYGANFNTNSTATTYTWSPTTGEEFINGVGQGASSTNKIYEAIWDGNGNDTYDLSNYTTAVSINLQPGAWSTFSSAQLADLDSGNPGQHLAHGNIANANLYNGDLRSLIENATGGSGNDTIVGNQGANTLNGGGGNDGLSGLDGNDTLIGGSGDDVLSGNAGADTLTGGAGSDSFNMYAGDSLVATPDTITDFQHASDNLDVRGIQGGYVYLAHTSGGTTAYYNYTAQSNYTEKVIATGDIEGNDVVADVGTIIYNDGTSGADNLFGGTGVDILIGEGGNDVLRGGLGADTLTGGAGADTFNQYTGESLVASPDTITDFEHGIDNINVVGIPGGTVVLNHLTATTTDVYYHAVSGSYTELIHVTGDVEAPDVVADNGTKFTISGSSAADTLVGGAAADNISGGSGNDSLSGGGGDDILAGGVGADTLTGGAGADKFNMFSGDSLVATPDTITDFQHGTDNIDVRGIAGGVVTLIHTSATATDVYYHFTDAGGNTELVHAIGDVEGSDVVADSGTQYQITGFSTAETLTGGAAADRISGGDGNDTLIGLDGADVLRGGLGADTLTGGTGGDKFDMYAGESLAASYDTITDFQRGIDNLDVIGIPGGSVFLVHSATGTDAAYHLVSGSYTEVVRAAGGDIEGADIRASTGTVITNYGYAAAETLVGWSGADVFYGNGGADTLTGGAGADLFVYTALSDSTGSAYDTITDFTHGSDKIDLSSLSGGLVGLYHDDYGNTGVAYGFANGAFGGVVSALGDVEGNDVYTQAGAQIYISGGKLGETLIGGAGVDTILGNDGNDTIQGGAGGDYLTGGNGIDTFKYVALTDSNPSVYDTINDFTSGTDKLDLTAVSGPFVNLVFDGAGHTYAYYGFTSSGAGGLVYANGSIQATDVIAAAGTAFYMSGSSGNDVLVGSGVGDTFVGAGGQDTLYGGEGADVFLYKAVSDSTVNAADYIADFQHGLDKVDLTAVAGGAVNIVHPGYGATFLYFAYNGNQASDLITITGDVEASDLIVAAGTNIVVTGSFSGPDHQPDAFHGV